MSRLFGPMRQVGIVVRDIDKAMRHWVEVCGIGPWFYAEQLPLTEFRYKGRVYDIKMSVALANSGDVQLELSQQRCDSRASTAIFSPPGMRAAALVELAAELPRDPRTSVEQRLADRPGGRHAARTLHIL
jgi:hypothetical protein